MSGVELIAAERTRQIVEEKFDIAHDMGHVAGTLTRAAAVYAFCAVVSLTKDAGLGALAQGLFAPFAEVREKLWPWGREWWKPKDAMRNLVRAGALIAAEIDRMIATDGDPNQVGSLPRVNKLPTLADLTYDPRSKPPEDLWILVREACRVRSDSWRAYEHLHSLFNQMARSETYAMDLEAHPIGTRQRIEMLQEAIHVLSPANASAIINRAAADLRVP